MTYVTVELLTSWTGTGAEEDPRRPAVGDDHALMSWSDVTRQPAEALPPAPNLLVVQARLAPEALAALLAD